MARPPRFERPGDLTRDRTAVKAALKHLTPADRAYLLAWLLLYFDDRGELYSPQLSRRRQRIVLDDEEDWLVRLPKQCAPSRATGTIARVRHDS
ncbi:MAG TPA: hypothetical protein VGI19_18930 [Candidatus Cybelea sp.]